MSEIEIALARAYLKASEQDPVAALIRSVRDLAATRQLVSAGYVRGCWPGSRDEDRVQGDGVRAPQDDRTCDGRVCETQDAALLCSAARP